MAGFAGHIVPEVKSLNDDGTFDGILSTYGNIDLVGDICEAGCFAKSLSDHGSRRQLLRDHDWSKVIGTFDVIDDSTELRIKGRICLDTEDGRDTWALMRFGALDGLSIGYWATKYHYDAEGIRHLDELDLREGSVVGDPANPMARIQAKSRRLARMSKYARCAFLTKMSPEDRDAALAELDRADEEAEKTEDNATDDPGKGEEVGKDETPADPEDTEEKDTEVESGEDGTLERLRAISKACSDLIERLEG